MEITNMLDKGVWSEFVREHPQSNIYHTPEMFQVYAQGDGFRPSLWAAVDGNRVLALHLPVQITLIEGPFHYLTTRDVSFGGVLVEESPEGRLGLAILLDEYNQQLPGAPIFTEMRNICDQTPNQQALAESGYEFEGHLNFLLDIDRKEDEILQNFNRHTRRRIRKAQREKNLVTQELTSKSSLPIFYRLLEKTFDRVRVPLADFSVFEAAFDLLRPLNMAYFSIALAEGMPAAAQVSLVYKGVMIGWFNGVDTSINLGSNEFLMWDVIQWGLSHGCHTLDFGGAGKPEEEYGVRDFKAKFGGELVNFGRNTRVHAPLRLAISQNAYSLARRSLTVMRQMSGNLESLPKTELNQ